MRSEKAKIRQEVSNTGRFKNKAGSFQNWQV